MRRLLGTLLTTACLVLVTGCGSSSSSAQAGPDSPGPGPIPGATVLPLISVTGAGGTVTPARLLDSPAAVRAFSRQFRPPTMNARIARAVAQARTSGYLVYGAVVAVGCDRPPGADVALDGNGDVQLTAQEAASPLPECLVPVTTVAIATVPGAQ